jgi:hypothetical protein
MLGVVKLQLGKAEQALPNLTAALRMAPPSGRQGCRHNLGLCLATIARQRCILESLKQAVGVGNTPFGGARRFANGVRSVPDGVSVILDVTEGSGVAASVASIAAQGWPGIEILAVGATDPDVEAALRAGCASGAMHCKIQPERSIGAAAAAASGDALCFMRAGDRWGPNWLRHVAAAVYGGAASWAFSGMRIIGDTGELLTFGVSPEVDALMVAQDLLYQQRTASLAFPSFNPIAGGSNLMIKRELWRECGFADSAGTSLLDWAWRLAWRYEPAYLDEPAYLIPQHRVSSHRHGDFLRLLDNEPLTAGDRDAAGVPPNAHLARGLAAYWSRQWRRIADVQASEMPDEILLGCAANLHGALASMEVRDT